MKRFIINDLINWKNKASRKPLILKGARQVGKTYILKQFAKENFKTYHYINFEKQENISSLFLKDLDPSRIIKELEIILNISIDKKNDLLILDEIQNCPQALSSLKYFCEEMSELAICAAGSLLGVELSTSSFPVGKVEFLEMYPMNFTEFLLALGEDKLFSLLTAVTSNSNISEIIHLKLWEILKIYFVVGGLPEIVSCYAEHKNNLIEAFFQVREKQDNLIKTYLADMAKYSGSENAMHLERLWRNIPAQLGRQLDGSAAKFIFKGIIPGIQAYSRLIGVFDWLEKARLLIKVPIVQQATLPLSSFVKENSFKAYCFDVGLLGALGNISSKNLFEIEQNTYKGFIAENFVAQELLTGGYSNLYCWRGRTAELEFIIPQENEILPIEVKSGWVTKSKSLNVFKEKYKPKRSIIFSARNMSINKSSGILSLPLYLAGSLGNFGA